MKKNYMFLHPPAVEKFTFLVDEINNSQNSGLCLDTDKISYNLSLLRTYFDFDLSSQFNEVKDVLTSSFIVGPFILAFSLDKNLTGFIFIIDFRADFNAQIIISITEMFDDRVLEHFFECKKQLEADFNPEYDIIELFVPEI